MLRADEMRVKAGQCEEMADRASDRLTAYTLRELADQWRDMANRLETLEHSPVYQAIRDRLDK
jgi:hypothetical protein